MHVLMVSDVYFPRVNGVSTSIATFRTALAGCGVESTLVAPAYPGTADEGDGKADGEADGILRVPARAVPLDPEDRVMRWRILMGLAPRLAHRQVDLVHIHTPFLAHYAGLRLARALGVPALATYHTLFEEYLYHYVPLVPRPVMRGLARGFSRAQCNALDAVVVPSSPIRERLAAYGVTRPMHVLPTGMPETAFVRGDGAAFRARHGIAADRPVALFVGRVAHEKNIGFLLEAVDHARRALPQALLIVAGDGPARAALRARAASLALAENVLFLGTWTAMGNCPAATRPPTCSCSPPAPRPRAWCCWRPWPPARRCWRWRRWAPATSWNRRPAPISAPTTWPPSARAWPNCWRTGPGSVPAARLPGRMRGAGPPRPWRRGSPACMAS